MKTLILLTLFALLTYANAKFVLEASIRIDEGLDYEWDQWKARFEKEYRCEEEESVRKEIWLDNLVYIQSFNSEKHSYTLGLNQFSDLTNKEFRETYLGYDYEASLELTNETMHEQSIPDDELAATVDWRTKGAVTPVKNQGRCGSCWAFSATGSLEGQYFLKHNILDSFSEQQLMDCSVSEGNHGCKGGLMQFAFKYWEQKKEEQEKDYPYEGKNGNCRYQESLGVVGDSGSVSIARGSESGLKDAVASIGPISVAMDAGHRSLQSYHSGVYSERACSSSKLDHGVLVIGYGTSSEGEDYWLVKNSWGTAWGMDGFFEIAMANNMCGICTQASYPKL